MIQSLEHFNIVKIAESGQCFRIRCTQDGLWLAAANGRVLRIRVLSEDQKGGSTCDFDCDGREFQEFWKDSRITRRSAALPIRPIPTCRPPLNTAEGSGY